ncbi:Type II secretion system protein F [Pseudobythopirellula maris]|uniref:Type II secretion system protein F n=1 Tax=Pseudobythopirellula maris TaxID=2527991 RepID=A0A5C5ZS72_9BACT|nr:type II secretion system F family protein [Pseudobythopirellula maris]TWT90150.1 Type II secretion system protein F [Pseudobythopirellula maris]
MPDFAYIARSLDGQRVEGVLSAPNQGEAMAALSARELFPLKVGAAAGSKAAASGQKQVRIASKHITPVYSQLAGLLRSGVPLLRSLTVIAEQSSHPPLVAVLEDLRTRVEDGSSLAEAMGRHPRVFGELSTSVVRAGGEGGFLEDALERVAAFTDQQEELKSKVAGAMAYPIILSVIGFLIVNGLIIFAVPMVEDLFARLKDKGELPWITEALLGLSDALQNYGLFIVAGVGVVIYFAYKWFETDEGRDWVDRWRLRVPMVGKIYRSLAVARFCRVLGTLLKGGVPIVRSLDIAADSTGNRVLTAVVKEAAETIQAGEPLAGPLSASGVFPRDVCEMIAVAEQSNNLEGVLNQVSDSLEKTTWRKIEVLVRLLEPLMLLVLAGVVLVVVIALLLPVIKLSTTM